MIKAGIIGASGYAGQETARLLSSHPEVNIYALTSRSNLGSPYGEVYENFRHLPYIWQTEDIETLANECDVIFAALPHGIMSEKVTQSILDKCIIIDLGADYRLKDVEVYEKWYCRHHSKDLINKAVYGLCEIYREDIKNSRLIANPGCYTTCSILALYPLVRENIIRNDIIIDAKSGVSGAGRGVSLGVHYNEVNESIKAYKVAAHRHSPEIEEKLSEFSDEKIKLTFTPHLVPMNRGILATSYGTLNGSYSYSDIRDIYEKYYGNEHFIRLTKEGVLPETKWVKASNFVDIGFVIDEHTNRIVVVSALDNLMKGAAGQAVQNMNIIFGWDEKTGLDTVPVFPA